MILFPNCKINLGLRVLRKREDGYHDLETVMLPVMGLSDIVEVIRCEDTCVCAGAEFSSSGLEVDCPDEQNLCLKAYQLLKRKHNIGAVRIHMHKIVPMGAGLGGGSADAVFVLKALNALFELGLSDNVMEQYAAELGSDTAFFVRNTAALASGRGELLTPIEVPLKGYYIVIVKPDIHISTREAYAGVKPSCEGASLTELLQQPVGQWKDCVRNDFENSLFECHPSLRQIKEAMYANGAVYASMSGSGSAVYGLFEREIEISEQFSDMFVYQGFI